MKFSKVASAALCFALTMGAASTHAALVSNASVNGLATFRDTTTNLVWLKLSSTYNMVYSAQVKTATAAGFVVADLNTLNTLWSGSGTVSTLAAWNNDNTIMGGSTSRALLWGNFASGSQNGWGYAYQNERAWNNYLPNNTMAFGDLGLWAYQAGAVVQQTQQTQQTRQTNAVPEPGSLALAGLALLGLGFSQRRRSA